MKEEKILNVLCLHFTKEQTYLPIGIEFFVVGRAYKNQREMIDEFKVLVVAQLNPQFIDGRMIHISWQDQEKTPIKVVEFWQSSMANGLPLFEDTLEGIPITDGRGKVLVEAKDLPFYHLKFWLFEVHESLPPQLKALEAKF